LLGPQSKSGVENRLICFQRHYCFELQARSKKEDAKKRKQKLLVDQKQEAKCQHKNVSDDWMTGVEVNDNLISNRFLAFNLKYFL